MSAETSQMSREDKFFGVETPLQIPDKEDAKSSPEPEIELDIVDDIPKQPVKQAEKEDDEELSDYSDKVRKRIRLRRPGPPPPGYRTGGILNLLPEGAAFFFA